MAREMAAMWRTANGLVGVPGQMSHPASDAQWHPEGAIPPERASSKDSWKSWIPSLEKTPPLAQFLVRAAQWMKAKFHAGAPQTLQLRLVAQLGLGAKRHLSLVEVGGAQFLVGGGVEHITVIVPIAAAATTATENTQNLARPHSL